MARLRVAVVGGGIFGCTIAIDLARHGVSVSLYEARNALLGGTTARCQARLHSGYHYPRSPETALAAKLGSIEFAARYPESIISDIPQFYSIASDGRTTPKDFVTFCKELDLPFRYEQPPQLHNVDICVRVPETFINVAALRQLVKKQLSISNVDVNLSQKVLENDLDTAFDLVIWATYGQNWQTPLRYEVCEVPLLKLDTYQNQSIVVLDGAYGGIDPHGKSYALYDVAHTLHWEWVGVGPPPVPEHYLDLVNRSPVPRSAPALTHLPAMIQSMGRFLHGLRPAKDGVSIYRGSLWSVRAVLPSVDATDERPTRIERSGNHIRVLSGKICTAVTAARQIAEMVLES